MAKSDHKLVTVLEDQLKKVIGTQTVFIKESSNFNTAFNGLTEILKTISTSFKKVSSNLINKEQNATIELKLHNFYNQFLSLFSFGTGQDVNSKIGKFYNEWKDKQEGFETFVTQVKDMQEQINAYRGGRHHPYNHIIDKLGQHYTPTYKLVDDRIKEFFTSISNLKLNTTFSNDDIIGIWQLMYAQIRHKTLNDIPAMHYVHLNGFGDSLALHIKELESGLRKCVNNPQNTRKSGESQRDFQNRVSIQCGSAIHTFVSAKLNIFDLDTNTPYASSIFDAKPSAFVDYYKNLGKKVSKEVNKFVHWTDFAKNFKENLKLFVQYGNELVIENMKIDTANVLKHFTMMTGGHDDQLNIQYIRPNIYGLGQRIWKNIKQILDLGSLKNLFSSDVNIVTDFITDIYSELQTHQTTQLEMLNQSNNEKDLLEFVDIANSALVQIEELDRKIKEIKTFQNHTRSRSTDIVQLRHELDTHLELIRSEGDYNFNQEQTKNIIQKIKEIDNNLNSIARNVGSHNNWGFFNNYEKQRKDDREALEARKTDLLNHQKMLKTQLYKLREEKELIDRRNQKVTDLKKRLEDLEARKKKDYSESPQSKRIKSISDKLVELRDEFNQIKNSVYSQVGTVLKFENLINLSNLTLQVKDFKGRVNSNYITWFNELKDIFTELTNKEQEARTKEQERAKSKADALKAEEESEKAAREEESKKVTAITTNVGANKRAQWKFDLEQRDKRLKQLEAELDKLEQVEPSCPDLRDTMINKTSMVFNKRVINYVTNKFRKFIESLDGVHTKHTDDFKTFADSQLAFVESKQDANAQTQVHVLSNAYNKVVNFALSSTKDYRQHHFDFIAKKMKKHMRYIDQWRANIGTSDDVDKTELVAHFNDVDKAKREAAENASKFYESFSALFDKMIKEFAIDTLPHEVRADYVARARSVNLVMDESFDRVFMYYNSKISWKDIVSDRQFILTYFMKGVNFTFLILSLYLTEQFFKTRYYDNVYRTRKKAPSLLYMLLLCFGLHASFNLVLVTLMFLVMLFFSKSTHRFVIDMPFISCYLIDYVTTTIIHFSLCAVVAYFAQRKRYFRYRIDGARSIRAMVDLIMFIGLVVYVCPIFMAFW